MTEVQRRGIELLDAARVRVLTAAERSELIGLCNAAANPVRSR